MHISQIINNFATEKGNPIMKEYKARIADKILSRRLKSVGAVLIQGPKWCGKTTTAEQQAQSVVYMDDPELIAQNIELAKLSPKTCLQAPHLALSTNGNSPHNFGMLHVLRLTIEMVWDNLSLRDQQFLPTPATFITLVQDAFRG